MAEKPTKYFLNLEKSNFNKKTILRLKDTQGQYIENKSNIINELHAFYSTLYAAEEGENRDFDEYIDEAQLPVLSEAQKEKLDSPITMSELSLAVKDLKNSKAPGVDGIPADFYKVFWNKLKEPLYEVIREIVKSGQMHLSARRGLISLIEKIGRDPLLLTNWRPITLLCTDLKIFDKIIALRLQSVMSELIHKSQTGFQKGKQLGENIMQLLAIIDYCESTETSAVIMSIDFYKAFDTIKWSAIDQILEKYNFGEAFRRWVKIVNTNITCTVLNNGKWKHWFPIQRGCWQGSPSSAHLFVLTAELLGNRIRKGQKIKGLKMYKETFVCCQYADNLWTVLFPEAENINAMLDELESFKLFSGLKVNYDKTSIFKLGPCRVHDFQFLTKKTLAWTDNPVKILGIWIHYNPEVIYSENLDKLLSKCQSILATWRHRGLTTIGRICIVNTLVSSLLSHKLAILPYPPPEFFKKYKTIILDFIWNKRRHKIRYEKLIQDYDNGGLKLIDTEAKMIALKAKWPLYFADRYEDWLYGIMGLDYRIWSLNINTQDIKRICQKLTDLHPLKQIWLAWSQVFYEYPDVEDISSQFIWGNSLIRRAGCPLFNNRCINCSISLLEQLIHQNEARFLTFEELALSCPNTLTFMERNAIIAAIPPAWKSVLKSHTSFGKSTKYEKIKRRKQNTKIFYKQTILKRNLQQAHKVIWEKELNIVIETDKWNSYFSDICKITNSVQLRDFHYRIINRILTTNVI